MITDELEFRVLVTGGREFNDAEFVNNTLGTLLLNCTKEFVLIHGDARGADTLAHLWAEDINATYGSELIKIKRCPAEWTKHNRFGVKYFDKAAGVRRNREMLERYKPHMVVAFEGGRGTQNMIEISEKAGLNVWKTWIK